MAVCHFDGIQSLCQGADLVYLDEYGVCASFFDAHGEKIHIGDKQVVTHQLAAVSDAVGQFLPAFPVVFRSFRPR